MTVTAVQHEQGEREGRFFRSTDSGRDAELTYRLLDDKTLDAHHTFVPRELRGQGVAKRLLDKLVDYARGENLRIVPSCPYVKAKAGDYSDSGARFVQ